MSWTSYHAAHKHGSFAWPCSVMQCGRWCWWHIALSCASCVRARVGQVLANGVVNDAVDLMVGVQCICLWVMQASQAGVVSCMCGSACVLLHKRTHQCALVPVVRLSAYEYWSHRACSTCLLLFMCLYHSIALHVVPVCIMFASAYCTRPVVTTLPCFYLHLLGCR
jgi:hypothetical protein